MAANQITKQAYFWDYFKTNNCQAEGWECLNRYSECEGCWRFEWTQLRTPSAHGGDCLPSTGSLFDERRWGWGKQSRARGQLLWGWQGALWESGWAESKPGAEPWLLGEPAVLTAEVAKFQQALCLSNQADGGQPMAVPLPTTLAQAQKADGGP